MIHLNYCFARVIRLCGAAGWFAILIASLLCFTRSPFSASADDQTSLRERLLKEGPAAWDSYKSYIGRSECRVTVVEPRPSQSEPMASLAEKYHLLYQAPNIRVTRFSSQTSKSLIVYGINEQYAFMLNQKSQGSPYVLKHVDSDASEIYESIDARVLQYVNSCWEFWGKTPAQLFAEPNCKLKEVAWVEEGGRRFVRASFDYNWDPKSGIGPLRSGWFLLSPENHWAIERYQIQLGKPGAAVIAMNAAVEFGDADGGFRKPTKVRYWGAKEEIATVCLIENWEHKTIDPSQFRLPAFGLPETIAKGGQPATPAALASGFGFGSGAWLIVLGALAAVAAVALRIWSYRAAASKARME